MFPAQSIWTVIRLRRREGGGRTLRRSTTDTCNLPAFGCLTATLPETPLSAMEEPAPALKSRLSLTIYQQPQPQQQQQQHAPAVTTVEYVSAWVSSISVLDRNVRPAIEISVTSWSLLMCWSPT